MTGIIKEERIGNQRLILGDCQKVMLELGKFDAVVTDPPYGMCFVSNSRQKETKHRPIANDKSTDLLKWACEIQTNHSKYIFCRWENLCDVPKPKSLITWIKNNHSMGDLKHEHGRQTEVLLFYAGPEHFFPKLRPSDVIKASRTGNELHPTQKPIGLMEVVAGWTNGAIVDPFMGSGTTLVACQKTGRCGTGIELDPDYFEIACNRVEEAARQPDLFFEMPRKPKQEDLI